MPHTVAGFVESVQIGPSLKSGRINSYLSGLLGGSGDCKERAQVESEQEGAVFFIPASTPACSPGPNLPSSSSQRSGHVDRHRGGSAAEASDDFPWCLGQNPSSHLQEALLWLPPSSLNPSPAAFCSPHSTGHMGFSPPPPSAQPHLLAFAPAGPSLLECSPPGYFWMAGSAYSQHILR